MKRRIALTIGLAALVAATSVGVLATRAVDGGRPDLRVGGSLPETSGEQLTFIDIVDSTIRERGDEGLLASFTSCGDLLDAVRVEAARHVGPWGWDGAAFGNDVAFGRGIAVDEAVTFEAAPAPAEEPAPAELAPAPTTAASDSVGALAEQSGVDFSVTNVQERGIDEPDLVKTDGKTIYVVAESSVYAVDASGEQPEVLSRLDLDAWGAQLLLYGDRLIVIGQGGFELPISSETSLEELAPYGGGGTTLTLVDVSRPAAMTVLETLNVEGAYITARLTGQSVRLVTSSFPEPLPFVYPQEEGFVPELAASLENQRIVARSSAGDWLPEYVRHDRVSGASESGLLVGCSSVRLPTTEPGIGMLSVLTIDPTKGLSPVDSDGIMTSAQTVYASADGLYVATPVWSTQSERGDEFLLSGRENTLVYRFDITQAFETSYRGSGEVRGSLLNQFSMSEHDGYLRVATTDHSQQESFVTVLDTRGDELPTVGRVGNLGLGEQIYAVRFLGKTGYVVTFRQTDPLYTIDLSNPEKPTVLGELKINGYSAYLHPIEEGLLLGIGQDADRNGRIKGTQISLFDVSNLEDPIRLHQARIGQGASSEAEYDHHAFLWWGSLNMAVLPVNAYRFDERTGQEEWFSGVVGAEVDREHGINSIGTLQHPRGSQIRRSLVIGDTLYTVSDRGVKASALDTFAERGWLPLN